MDEKKSPAGHGPRAKKKLAKFFKTIFHKIKKVRSADMLHLSAAKHLIYCTFCSG